MSPARRWTAIGAVLATLCLGAGIGSTELWSPDEPRVAAVSRDMLREGNWLVPRLNGQPFLEEPPLFYWLQAASYRIGGVSAVTARAPAVAGAVLGVLATALLARALGTSAAIAVVVLATAPEYWWMARAATPDTTNAAMTTLALALFFLAWRSGSGSLLAGAVATAAAAFWLKSFLGVGLAVVVVAIFVLAAGRGRLGWGTLALAAGALGIASAAWLLVLARSEGTRAVSFFVVTNHLERLTRIQPGAHARSLLYYVPNLALGLLPWCIVVPGALLAAWRNRRDPARLFPLLWASTMVVALSVASTKRAHYPLAAYPAFAVLVAGWWPRAMEHRLGRLTGGLLAGTVLVGCPLLVLTLLHLDPPAVIEVAEAAADEPSRWLGVLRLVAVHPAAWMAVVPSVAAAALFVRARRARDAAGTVLATGLAVTLVHLVIVLSVLPGFNRWCSARSMAEQLVARGVPVAVFGFQNREKLSGLVFYTDRYLPELRDANALTAFLAGGPACALVDPESWDELSRTRPDVRGTPARAGRLPLVLVSGRAGGCPAADT